MYFSQTTSSNNVSFLLLLLSVGAVLCSGAASQQQIDSAQLMCWVLQGKLRYTAFVVVCVCSWRAWRFSKEMKDCSGFWDINKLTCASDCVVQLWNNAAWSFWSSIKMENSLQVSELLTYGYYTLFLFSLPSLQLWWTLTGCVACVSACTCKGHQHHGRHQPTTNWAYQ